MKRWKASTRICGAATGLSTLTRTRASRGGSASKTSWLFGPASRSLAVAVVVGLVRWHFSVSLSLHPSLSFSICARARARPFQALAGDLAGAVQSLNAFCLVWRDWGFLPEEYDYGAWQLSGTAMYPLRPELVESIYLVHFYCIRGKAFFLLLGPRACVFLLCARLLQCHLPKSSAHTHFHTAHGCLKRIAPPFPFVPASQPKTHPCVRCAARRATTRGCGRARPFWSRWPNTPELRAATRW